MFICLYYFLLSFLAMPSLQAAPKSRTYEELKALELKVNGQLVPAWRNQRATEHDGAGVFFWAWHSNEKSTPKEPCVLLGKRRAEYIDGVSSKDLWCSPGGKAEGERLFAEVASQEGYEESLFYNIHPDILKTSPSHDLVTEKSRFRLYFTEVIPRNERDFITQLEKEKDSHRTEFEDYCWVPLANIQTSLVSKKDIIFGDRTIRLFDPFRKILHTNGAQAILESIIEGKRRHSSLHTESTSCAELNSANGSPPLAIKWLGNERTLNAGDQIVEKTLISDMNELQLRKEFGQAVALKALLNVEFKALSNASTSKANPPKQVTGLIPQQMTQYSASQAHLKLFLAEEYIEGDSLEVIETNLRNYYKQTQLIVHKGRDNFYEIGEDDYKLLARIISNEIKNKEQYPLYHGLRADILHYKRTITHFHRLLFVDPTKTRLRSDDMSYIKSRGLEEVVKHMQDGGERDQHDAMCMFWNRALTVSLETSKSGSDSVGYMLSQHNATDQDINGLLSEFTTLLGFEAAVAPFYDSLLEQYIHPSREKRNSGMIQAFVSPHQIDNIAYTCHPGGDLFNYEMSKMVDRKFDSYSALYPYREAQAQAIKSPSPMASKFKNEKARQWFTEVRSIISPESHHKMEIHFFDRYPITHKGRFDSEMKKLTATVLGHWLSSHTKIFPTTFWNNFEIKNKECDYTKMELKQKKIEGEIPLKRLYRYVYEGQFHNPAQISPRRFREQYDLVVLPKLIEMGFVQKSFDALVQMATCSTGMERKKIQAHILSHVAQYRKIPSFRMLVDRYWGVDAHRVMGNNFWLYDFYERNFHKFQSWEEESDRDSDSEFYDSESDNESDGESDIESDSEVYAENPPKSFTEHWEQFPSVPLREGYGYESDAFDPSEVSPNSEKYFEEKYADFTLINFHHWERISENLRSFFVYEKGWTLEDTRTVLGTLGPYSDIIKGLKAHPLVLRLVKKYDLWNHLVFLDKALLYNDKAVTLALTEEGCQIMSPDRSVIGDFIEYFNTHKDNLQEGLSRFFWKNEKLLLGGWDFTSLYCTSSNRPLGYLASNTNLLRLVLMKFKNAGYSEEALNFAETANAVNSENSSSTNLYLYALVLEFYLDNRGKFNSFEIPRDVSSPLLQIFDDYLRLLGQFDQGQETLQKDRQLIKKLFKLYFGYSERYHSWNGLNSLLKSFIPEAYRTSRSGKTIPLSPSMSEKFVSYICESGKSTDKIKEEILSCKKVLPFFKQESADFIVESYLNFVQKK